MRPVRPFSHYVQKGSQAAVSSQQKPQNKDKRIARILAVANQKGGVGKTTTTVNLATAMAAIGKRVLIIDMDPQGNGSTGLGVDRKDRQRGTYELIFGDIFLKNVSRETSVPNLHIVPATVELAGADIELVNAEEREFKLLQALSHGENTDHPAYDYIFIDCPPSLSLLTLNALVAAHAVIIPLQCEFYALEGLSQLTKTIERIRRGFNPMLTVHGVLLTMYDQRNNLSGSVADDVRNYFGDTVYSTVIPRNVRVSEAPSHGLPAMVYDLKCAGSQAYIQLAKEVLKREQRDGFYSPETQNNPAQKVSA